MMVLLPSKGSSILDSVGWFDHQDSSAFFTLSILLFTFSLFSILLACRSVSGIPISVISHEKWLSTWKYIILTWYMHIFCSCLFDVLKRNKRGFRVHRCTLKGRRDEDERLRGFSMCSFTQRKKTIKEGCMEQIRRVKGKAFGFLSALCAQGKYGGHIEHSWRLHALKRAYRALKRAHRTLMHSRGLREGTRKTLEV